MAYSENFLAMEQSDIPRSDVLSSSLPESFAGSTNMLFTGAAQRPTASAANAENRTLALDSRFFSQHNEAAASPALPEEAEIAPRRRISPNVAAVSGGTKVSKRKPRKSKQSLTTFIMADPANFRQMVQQVTGIGSIGGAHHPLPVKLAKPEAVAAGVRPPWQSLDTSASALNRQHERSHFAVGLPTHQLGPGHAIGNNSSGVKLDFETRSIFPTLESWNADL